MTISSTTRVAGPFIGNGTATVFPFTFKVFAAADLDVIRLNTSTGVESTLVLNSDYTVTLNGNQNTNPGGSVTLSAGALATGLTLTITSDIANLQPTDLTNQGGFYPEVITDSLDRATIQIQQISDIGDRTIKIPISDGTGLDLQLPTQSQRANKYLVFNASGEPSVSAGSGTDTALRTDLASTTPGLAGASLIGIRDSNAFAVGRTLAAKINEVWSVKDFGAEGDGINDDTLAFQDATFAQATNPGSIFVPSGTYYITGSITGKFFSFGGVTLTGGGSVTSITNLSQDLTVDGTTLVVNSTTNRVGIGTASPSQTLDVTGNAAVSGNLTAGGDVGITGDLTVTGNDIKSSTATAITMSGTNVTVVGDLAVNGADITTTASGTATVFNATATTVNVGGAATAMAVGSQSAGTVTVNNLSMNAGYGSIAAVFGCRAWVNFDGSASGTFAGGASTVTRASGSSTATITTTNNHGLITGNAVYAASGVVADNYIVTVLTNTTFTITTVATTPLTATPITFNVANIRASGNVSSIADNGTGDYTVNFATAMPDVNYSFVHSSWDLNRSTPNQAAVYERSSVTERTVASFRVSTTSLNTAAYTDFAGVYLAIFR